MPLELEHIYQSDAYKATSIKEALTFKIVAALKKEYELKDLKIAIVSHDKNLALALSVFRELASFDVTFAYLGNASYGTMDKKELACFEGTFLKELPDADLYILNLEKAIELNDQKSLVAIDELTYFKEDNLEYDIDRCFIFNTYPSHLFTKNNYSHINKIRLIEDSRLGSYHKGVRLIDENFELPVNDLGNKGDFGRSLLIGGSKRMHGAIEMAANAAYRMGVGTLTLLIPDCIYHEIALKNSFAMILEGESKDGYFKELSDLSDLLAPFDLIGAGNGMGRNSTNIKIIQELLLSDKPLVLDADALWSIKNNRDLLRRDQLTVLLPHLKEMTYLCDKSLEEIKKDPFKIAYDFSLDYPNAILVLKSYITIIAQKGHVSFLNKPKRALAKGGSGDALMGIVMGALSQNEDPFRMTELAVFVHNKAAEYGNALSFMVDDLINNIPKILDNLK